MISRDGGSSWNDIPSEADQPLFRAATYGDETVIIGRAGTILISRDGADSFKLEKEKEFTTFSGICPHPQGGFVCVGEMGKIYRIE